MLQDVLKKSGEALAATRHDPLLVHAHYEVTERRACALAMCSRSLYNYESRRDPRTALRARIREIAQTRVRYGYRRVHVLLYREGWKANHKLVYRLYRGEGLCASVRSAMCRRLTRKRGQCPRRR